MDGYYSVRSVTRLSDNLYEERITLWKSDSFEAAIALAERDAEEYAALADGTYVGLAQAFHLSDSPTDQGAEVFSLIRESSLSPKRYVDRYFDSGTEKQGHVRS